MKAPKALAGILKKFNRASASNPYLKTLQKRYFLHKK
jgi:hypothetical protein